MLVSIAGDHFHQDQQSFFVKGGISKHCSASEQVGLGGVVFSVALGAFEGVVGSATGGGHLQAGAVEELVDGEDLDGGVVSLPEFGVVEASLGGGFVHGTGGFF